MEEKSKVVVVVGPTASGKTAFGVALAKHFDGEIISADSRQVYRGLDIGSGKVTAKEMCGVPHHLLDVADPESMYTAADYRRDATSTLRDIRSRNKLPFIVGGTFFYIETLLCDTPLPEVPPNDALRAKLELLDADTLFRALEKTDSERAATIDPKNKRRLIRALEIVEALGVVPERGTTSTRYDTLMLGIDIPKDTLRKNIKERLYARFDAGMVEEAKRLHADGLSYERMDDLGLEYRYLAKLLEREMTEEEIAKKLETEIWHFAKRQLTWLKREKGIVWVKLDDTVRAKNIVQEFLDS